MRPVRYVGELVPGQVILALERRIADIADKAPLHGMRDDVLFDQAAVRIGHLAFGAAVERGAVQRFRFTYFAGLRPGFLLLWGFLLFGLLAGGGGAASGIRGAHCRSAAGNGGSIADRTISIAIDAVGGSAVGQSRASRICHVGHVAAMVHAHQPVMMAPIGAIIAGRQCHASQRQAGQIGAILQDIAGRLLLYCFRILEEVLYGDWQCCG